jgi:hypothetical protein
MFHSPDEGYIPTEREVRTIDGIATIINTIPGHPDKNDAPATNLAGNFMKSAVK